jgi:DNA repair exonuclease SbcCD nuclease subunit
MEPIRFLAVGDPHIKLPLIRENERMIEAVIRKTEEMKPDFVVLLGDLLDSHEKIHVVPLMLVTKLIKELSDLVMTYILIGNHDRPNNSVYLTDEHPFNSFKCWKNVKIVDTTFITTIRSHIFTFVPYVPNGKFISALDMVENWSSSTAIFGHQEIRGTKLSADTISTEGDVWPRDYPQLILGHIHEYSEPFHNVLYTGTALQISFSEREDKSISYFTFDNNKKMYHERIDLELPKRLQYTLTPQQFDSFQLQPNKIIRITIICTQAEIKVLHKTEKFKQLIKSGVKIIFKQTHVMDNSRTNTLQGQSSKYKNYSTILYDDIKENEKLRALFEEFFGQINRTTLKIVSPIPTSIPTSIHTASTNIIKLKLVR